MWFHLVMEYLIKVLEFPTFIWQLLIQLQEMDWQTLGLHLRSASILLELVAKKIQRIPLVQKLHLQERCVHKNHISAHHGCDPWLGFCIMTTTFICLQVSCRYFYLSTCENLELFKLSWVLQSCHLCTYENSSLWVGWGVSNCSLTLIKSCLLWYFSWN